MIVPLLIAMQLLAKSQRQPKKLIQDEDAH